jgi:mannose-6-phosphate isomerase-like protein (cupin superfamily)
MKGFIGNIEKLSEDNVFFRKVLYTSSHSQLVVMSLRPKEEIGIEVHEENDQFLRFETGKGVVVIDGVSHDVSGGFAVVIPSGAKHNVVNTSDTEYLKLYTIYSPAHHRDGVVHKTREDAVKDEEEFDGKTSE